MRRWAPRSAPRASRLRGPAGSGSRGSARCPRRALLRRKREAVVSCLCAGGPSTRPPVRNVAVTLGVDEDDAVGRTVVASSNWSRHGLDNDAQWLARKRGVSLVVVDRRRARTCRGRPQRR